MESTRPIRALMRGLDALTVLNMRDGASVTEVAQEISLPRTTAYRILETLCDAGFVFRDAADERYRLTISVRSLSGGFDDDAWVQDIAKPLINDLCREIVWPVAIATLSGAAMVLRESTDHSSPLAMERYTAGRRLPLLTSASGRAYLAHCPAQQRDALIEILSTSKKEEDKPARVRGELLNLLAQIKSRGYALTTRTVRFVEQTSISTPVMVSDRVIAALTVRFVASAVPTKAGVERFLPKLRQCAAGIGTLFSEHQAQAASKGAPKAAA